MSSVNLRAIREHNPGLFKQEEIKVEKVNRYTAKPVVIVQPVVREKVRPKRVIKIDQLDVIFWLMVVLIWVPLLMVAPFIAIFIAVLFHMIGRHVSPRRSRPVEMGVDE